MRPFYYFVSYLEDPIHVDALRLLSCLHQRSWTLAALHRIAPQLTRLLKWG